MKLTSIRNLDSCASDPSQAKMLYDVRDGLYQLTNNETRVDPRKK